MTRPLPRSEASSVLTVMRSTHGIGTDPEQFLLCIENHSPHPRRSRRYAMSLGYRKLEALNLNIVSLD